MHLLAEFMGEIAYVLECELDDKAAEERQRQEEEAERAYLAAYLIDATSQLYLVERACGGDDASGGGCGAWYVADIRERRDGDRLDRRDSPDGERSFYKDDPRIHANWHRAHPDDSIWGGFWVCSSCRRIEW